jgi:hypothetical protein
MQENDSDYCLTLWTVYDKPKDFPEKYVARLFVTSASGAHPTDQIFVADTITEIREEMIRRGLSCLARSDNDDPVIVEVWL